MARDEPRLTMPLLRADVVGRLRHEIDSAFPGEQAFEVASVDDVDDLARGLQAVIDDLRPQLQHD